MASHPPRLKDFSYTGRHYYFLTFCTHEHQQLFVEAENVGILRAQLLQSSRAQSVAVHAYCAMPDHVHLLGQGIGESADVRAFMHHFKQHTGWRYRQQRGGRLWQGSYYDHVVREEEGIAGVIAYIVNNPVRAGLVDKPEDYPFWGSFTQTREALLECIRGSGDFEVSPKGLTHRVGADP